MCTQTRALINAWEFFKIFDLRQCQTINSISANLNEGSARNEQCGQKLINLFYVWLNSTHRGFNIFRRKNENNYSKLKITCKHVFCCIVLTKWLCHSFYLQAKKFVWCFVFFMTSKNTCKETLHSLLAVLQHWAKRDDESFCVTLTRRTTWEF